MLDAQAPVAAARAELFELVDVAMTVYRQKFDCELEAIEAQVIELFAMVAEDLPGATNALLSGNNEVLGVLAERQQVIHALHPQIEKQAQREILLQAPVAGDLRFLLSVLRILPDLERRTTPS